MAKGNPLIKAANEEMEYTVEQQEELIKCMEDPIYFIETYVMVMHPTRGAVKFKMYEYQKRYIRHLQSNRFSITMQSRQMGKTITTAMFLLWRACFEPTLGILIASKDDAGAVDIMDRIRFAYEELPMWLKPGVKDYNKHNIVFDNKTKIRCQATTAKTGRGFSVSCIDGTTKVNIEENGITSEVNIEDLYWEKYDISRFDLGDVYCKLDTDRDAFLENKYMEKYMSFVLNRPKGDYLHFIIPLSMGGEKSNLNSVYLTKRDKEHSLKLLLKITQGKHCVEVLKQLNSISGA